VINSEQIIDFASALLASSCNEEEKRSNWKCRKLIEFDASTEDGIKP